MKAVGMQDSSSEESYAYNSSVQNRNFHAVAKPYLAEAVERMLRNIVCASKEVDKVCEAGGRPANGCASAPAPARRTRQHIAVADMGCSYGSNTLQCAQFVLKTLQESWRREETITDEDGFEVQYYFSDLPSNDFNALFQSLPSLTRKQKVGVARVRVAGVPGSFYGKLFPSASLDLVMCSYALHWLSEVPPAVLDKSSCAWNGGHTWINQGVKIVLDAYALQAQIGMTKFLKNRAYELAKGGILFLFIPASSSMQQRDCLQPHKDSTWTLFDCAWKEMIDEGLITLDQMDMFNMPIYFLNEHELEQAVQKVPQLKLLQMRLLEDTTKEDKLTLDEWHRAFTSVTKPLLETYLGEDKANELLKRFKNIASRYKDLNKRFVHSLIVASLERL